MIVLNITPVAKPRQTRSDKWKKRPVVLKYRAYSDELRKLVSRHGYELKTHLNAIFVLPMPKSWSKKKKLSMIGQLHESRPDLDNIEKGFQDSLLGEDSMVAVHNTKKIWGTSGMIVLDPDTEEPF